MKKKTIYCENLGASLHPLTYCGGIWREGYACGFEVDYPMSHTAGIESEKFQKEQSKRNRKLAHELHKKYHKEHGLREPQNTDHAQYIK